ncbi:MAG: MFS transporter [Nocardioidaceae bacterium]
MPSITTTVNPGRRTVLIMTSLVLALIPMQLDALVTAPAVPTIAGDLGGFDKIAWITTSYLLTMAIGMVASGRVGDMFGRRNVLVTALLVFLGGTMWAALSGDMTALIVGRAIQGLGAGMTFTSVLASVADVAPPEKRAKYQAVFGAVAPFSMIAGPWAGGLVTDHLGWRWIFWLNTPIVVLALVGVLLMLRLPRRRTGGRVDLPGMAALSLASAGLTLGASWGGQYGWASGHVLIAAITGAVGIVGVWYAERRAPQPILPLNLFTNRAVLMSFVVMFLGTGAVMMSAVAYLPVFLQIVQGESASSSGLLLLPMLLPAIATALGIGRWTTRSSRFRPVLIAGAVLLALGCSLLATVGTTTPLWQASAWMILTGAGVGMLMQTPLVLVQNTAPRHEIGAATGSASFLRMIGGAIGVGVLGSAFVNRFASQVSGAGVPGTAGLDIANVGPDRLQTLSPAAHEAVLDAAASANSQLFWIAALLAVLAVVAALVTPRSGVSGPSPEEAAPADERDPAVAAVES